MNKPLVSVVIPVYNSADTINSALSSVVAQTYRPIEVIVVDDGSTDETGEVIEKFGREVILNKAPNDLRFISRYQDNAGPSKARNSGIKEAEGEYIAFLDADDLWTEDKIAKQMQLFRRDPKLDIVFCNATVEKLKNGKRMESSTFESHKLDSSFFGHSYLVTDAPLKMLRLNFMLTPAVMLKKKCFDGGMFFNENRRYAEDWELWLKMSLSYNLGYIKEVCVMVRDEGDGLSAQVDSMLSAKLEVMEHFVIENREYLVDKLTEKGLSRLLKSTYKWSGYHLMLQKNKGLAKQYFKRSLQEGFDIKTFYYLIRTSLS